MTTPTIIIAGTHSGAGKTSISLAVMAGLKKSGYTVQAYKVGPDYIDPSYHTVVTGRPSHNLDDWMMGEGQVRALFDRTSVQADIAVIEGVMGLFDGASSTGDEGSTANIAKILKAPVILVVDAGKMARSAAAIVKGYQTLDPDVQICGVILNRVASKNHLDILKEAIAHYNQIPVLGVIGRDETIRIPERHLGLTTATENPQLRSCLAGLEKYTTVPTETSFTGIDLAEIVRVAQQKSQYHPEKMSVPQDRPGKTVRIAYAKDRAFHFYYQANLDILASCGAELVAFSPLEDQALPELIGGIYFGGGFPEIYAKELEENISMRLAVQEAVKQGMPVYAECGGLIYLAQSVKNLSGDEHHMAGVIPGRIDMTDRLQNFGYCENTLIEDCFLGKKGDTFRGHEFHYSVWSGEGTQPAHLAAKKRNKSARPEGYCRNNVFASYVHCHFSSCPQRAEAFVRAAEQYSNSVNTVNKGKVYV